MADTKLPDPIDMAITLMRGQLDAGMRVMVARADDPTAFPNYGETPSLDAICRRMVATLLNEGWVLPGATAARSYRSRVWPD